VFYVLWAANTPLNGSTAISIPAGTQTLTLAYRGTDSKSEYTGTVKITHDFEAGHHYLITPERYTEGGQTYARATVEDLGTNTSMFHNGVYTGVAGAMDAHLGSGGLSYVTAGLGLGFKTVFDVGTVLELSANGGVDFGIGPGGYNPITEETSVIGLALGAFGGLFGHFYIPRTDISIGAGYGYRAEVGLGSPYDSFYSPFIRGELMLAGGGVYFEYYTDPSYLSLFDSQAPDNFNIFKKWGVGLFGRL